MLTALLVDDEIKNLEGLAFMLQNDCEDITVAASLNNYTLKQRLKGIISMSKIPYF